MIECLTPELIDRYCDGRVNSLKEVRAIDAHLATCAACREAVREAVSGAAMSLAQKLTLSAGESACLNVDMLVRTLRGEADAAEMEMVNAHTEVCAHCADNLASLRTLYQQREIAAPVVAPPSSGWARWREWLFVSPHRWFALQASGVAAVAAVTALLILWMTTRPLQQQVVELQGQLRNTNDALQKQVAAITDLKTQHAHLQKRNEEMQQKYSVAAKTVNKLQTQLATVQKQASSSSQILLTLNDGGGQLAVDRQGHYVRMEPLPSAVKDALKNQRVKPPVLLAALIGGQGILRSGTSEGIPFALYSPVGTVVRSDHPTFRWQSLDGATSYTVTVVDEANDKTAAKSEPLTGTEWTTLQPLKRGSVYRWFVTALKDGQEIQSPNKAGVVAKFKVLEQKKAEELESAKKKYAHSHLTLGILYVQAGLLDEAEQEFQTLADANPKSPIARKLLQSVKTLRRK